MLKQVLIGLVLFCTVSLVFCEDSTTEDEEWEDYDEEYASYETSPCQLYPQQYSLRFKDQPEGTDQVLELVGFRNYENLPVRSGGENILVDDNGVMCHCVGVMESYVWWGDSWWHTADVFGNHAQFRAKQNPYDMTARIGHESFSDIGIEAWRTIEYTSGCAYIKSCCTDREYMDHSKDYGKQCTCFVVGECRERPRPMKMKMMMKPKPKPVVPTAEYVQSVDSEPYTLSNNIVVELSSIPTAEQVNECCELIAKKIDADVQHCTGERSCMTCVLGFNKLFIGISEYASEELVANSMTLADISARNMKAIQSVLRDGDFIKSIANQTGVQVKQSVGSAKLTLLWMCMGIVAAALVLAGAVWFLRRRSAEQTPLIENN